MIIILLLCLCTTTVVLVLSNIPGEDGLLHTGSVKINLNDGRPIIHENELSFEPGMTVEKVFFIENVSTAPVYYKLYFDHVSGGLANALVITFKDEDKVLYTGTADQLTRQNAATVDRILPAGEKKSLTAVFHFPKECGNSVQGLDLTFTLCADATQAVNNPERLFEPGE